MICTWVTIVVLIVHALMTTFAIAQNPPPLPSCSPASVLLINQSNTALTLVGCPGISYQITISSSFALLNLSLTVVNAAVTSFSFLNPASGAFSKVVMQFIASHLRLGGQTSSQISSGGAQGDGMWLVNMSYASSSSSNSESTIVSNDAAVGSTLLASIQQTFFQGLGMAASAAGPSASYVSLKDPPTPGGPPAPAGPPQQPPSGPGGLPFGGVTLQLIDSSFSLTANDTSSGANMGLFSMKNVVREIGTAPPGV
ncbi:membrane-associated protein, putative, partial [Bodo saltans]